MDHERVVGESEIMWAGFELPLQIRYKLSYDLHLRIICFVYTAIARTVSSTTMYHVHLR